MTGRRALIVLSAAAALSAGLPAAAFGQAAVGSGSAASEYGDYVPTTSGTSTPKHASTPRSTRHSTPTRHSSSPPRVRHYVAPARPATPVTPRTVAPAAAAPVEGAAVKRHKPRRHRPHHAAAVHKTKAAKPVASKAHGTSVPAAPAASVDGGSGQLLLLGLAMLTMTVAVFARAGLRKRHGSI